MLLDGLDLVPLPPTAPELQSAGRLWPVVHKAIANRVFAGLDTLEATLVMRCQTVHADPQPIRDVTRCGWWPDDTAAGQSRMTIRIRYERSESPAPPYA